jgi:hypothetical protein
MPLCLKFLWPGMAQAGRHKFYVGELLFQLGACGWNGSFRAWRLGQRASAAGTGQARDGCNTVIFVPIQFFTHPWGGVLQCLFHIEDSRNLCSTTPKQTTQYSMTGLSCRQVIKSPKSGGSCLTDGRLLQQDIPIDQEDLQTGLQHNRPRYFPAWRNRRRCGVWSSR